MERLEAAVRRLEALSMVTSEERLSQAEEVEKVIEKLVREKSVLHEVFE